MKSFIRTTTHFHADNEILSAWFYFPKENKSPYPCIIMSHGFCALKEHQLDQFAQVFSEAGFCVLIYDHRNCGESSGEPRYEIDPQIQIRDYSHAISYVQTLPQVNPNAIGIWGTSYSGGHVLAVAALDKRVKSVVAQVPFIKGHHDYLKQKRPEQWEIISTEYKTDLISRQQGNLPKIIPVVSRELKSHAVMKGERAYDFFSAIPAWPNSVTLQSVAMSGDYNPGQYLSKITTTPLLFIVADEDKVNSSQVAINTFEQTVAPKKLVMILGDHFSPYLERFTEAATAAVEWYKNTLFN